MRNEFEVNTEALKSLRIKDGHTIRSLARKLEPEVSFSYLAQIERGTKVPSPAVAKRIAEALDVPLSAFFRRRAHDSAQQAVTPVAS